MMKDRLWENLLIQTFFWWWLDQDCLYNSNCIDCKTDRNSTDIDYLKKTIRWCIIRNLFPDWKLENKIYSINEENAKYIKFEFRWNTKLEKLHYEVLNELIEELSKEK